MEEVVKTILRELVDNPEISEKITKDTNIVTDIGIDSLTMINFIVKIEEELNVCIDFEKFNYDHLSSVKKFSKFLEQCKKQM